MPNELFWEKVNKNSGIFGADGTYATECWEWTAAKNEARPSLTSSIEPAGNIFKMNNKIDNYISGLYRNSPRYSIKTQYVFWMLLSFVGCGLGAWALFFGGPAKALSAAHAITWYYIILNTMMIVCMAGIGIMRAIISHKHPIVSDTILFANTRRHLIIKITSLIETPLVAALALYVDWTVASTLLVIQFALEITTRNIIKINQANRRRELEAYDEKDLVAALISPEEEMAIRDQIN